MLKIKYSLQQQDPVEVELKSDQEVIIGRDENCDIVLQSYKGISRKHVRIHYSNNEWLVEKISQHGEFPSGALNNETEFKIGPYSFEFEVATEAKMTPANLEHSRTLALKPSMMPKGSNPEEAFEGTVVGVKKLVPYLKIEWPDRASPEVFQLKGDKWILGRDPKCDLPIEYAEMSRHHFELSIDGSKVYVQDMGSSNGTMLNGEPLHPRVPVLLHSGDYLQVQELKIYFEWRDPNYHALVPSLQNPPEPQVNMLAGPIALAVEDSGEAVEQLGKPKRFEKKTLVRAAMVLVLAVILAVGFLMPSKKEEQSLSSKTTGEQALSASQKSAVRDSFQLALHLYKQGKYELCMSELQKLHQIIPQYENSKELQDFCSHGHELVLIQKDRERKEREQQAIRQQIVSVITQCRASLKPFDAPEKHIQCLTPATELDPENREIQQIIKTAQDFEKQRMEQRRLAAARAERILASKKHFEKAQNLKKQGDLKVALKEYEAYIKANYPDSVEQKEIAQREIAGIKKELSDRIQSRLELCNQASAKNQWKIGYQSCDDVLKEDPTNAKAKQERDRMLSELRREMKAIYEDSVLEESLGNVDTAKEKWKKITEENLPFDDYTKKATQKLRKYGIGI